MREKHGLDATDIRILGAVQTHGQLSKTRLAEIVNLSPTPCWERLTRLKAAGFIRGYRAEIALDRLADFTQVVVTVSLAHHRKQDFDRFEACIRDMDEITRCVATGGGMDYVMTVLSPSLAAFQNLMESLLAAGLGIERYMTYIVTRKVKTEPPNLARLVAGTGG
jgi:Lrp/AsnC family transcriptional regulator, regulator of ectoine-degradation genes